MPATALIETIQLSPLQPRTFFDPQKLSELAASIKEHGVLEPLIVRCLGEDQYELVAGERRLRASQEAGLKQVPIIVRDLDDRQALHIALVENIQREDLNPVEEVEAMLHLVALELTTAASSEEQKQWTAKQVVTLLHRMQNEAKGKVTHNVMGSAQAAIVNATFAKLGVSWKSFVSNKLPVLKWPEDVLEKTKVGAIAFEKAKLISRVKDVKRRKQLIQKTIRQSLSTQEVRGQVKAIASSPPSSEIGEQPSPESAWEVESFKASVRQAYKHVVKSPQIADDPDRLFQAEQLFNLFLTSLDQLLEVDPNEFYD